MHSPIVVSLLGPEVDLDEPIAHPSNEGNDVAQGDGNGEEENGDDTTLVTAPERRPRQTMRLGSGLPTAGALLARLGPDGGPETEDWNPGTGYAIEVSLSFLNLALFFSISTLRYICTFRYLLLRFNKLRRPVSQ